MLKKLHSIKWAEICEPISKGGLGIRNSKNNNITILAKTCWKYVRNENLICSKVLKARYCLNKSFWEAK